MSATCIGAMQKWHEMMKMRNACGVMNVLRHRIMWNLWLFYKVVYIIQEHVLENYHYYSLPCKSTWLTRCFKDTPKYTLLIIFALKNKRETLISTTFEQQHIF
jgi:hypothetical protein